MFISYDSYSIVTRRLADVLAYYYFPLSGEADLLHVSDCYVPLRKREPKSIQELADSAKLSNSSC